VIAPAGSVGIGDSRYFTTRGPRFHETFVDARATGDNDSANRALAGRSRNLMKAHFA
jgi:hypothetical protein